MQEFGAFYYKNNVYVNFETDENIGGHFETDIHADYIISVLERYYKIKIIPERHRGNVGVLSLLYCRWYAGSSEGGYYRK